MVNAWVTLKSGKTDEHFEEEIVIANNITYATVKDNKIVFSTIDSKKLSL